MAEKMSRRARLTRQESGWWRWPGVAVLVLLVAAAPAAVRSAEASEALQQAQSLYEKGMFNEAAEVWLLLAEHDDTPTAREAALSYANVLRKLERDPQTVLEAYMKVAQRWPQTASAATATLRAANTATKIDTAQATALYKDVVKQYDGQREAAEAKLRLGFLAHRVRELAAAEEYFWEAARDDSQASGHRAEAYKQYGFTAIMRYFQEAPTKPTQAQGHLVEARERLIQAIAVLKEMPNERASAALCAAGVGETYLIEKRFDEAARMYEQGLRCEIPLPSDVEALLRHGLGIAWCHLSRYESGLTELAMARELAAQPTEESHSIPSEILRLDAAIMGAAVLSGLNRNVEALTLLEPYSREAAAKAEIWTSSQKSLLGCRALTWEGLILYRLGDRTSGVARCQLAQRLYPQATEQVETARVLEQAMREAE